MLVTLCTVLEWRAPLVAGFAAYLAQGFGASGIHLRAGGRGESRPVQADPAWPWHLARSHIQLAQDAGALEADVVSADWLSSDSDQAAHQLEAWQAEQRSVSLLVMEGGAGEAVLRQHGVRPTFSGRARAHVGEPRASLSLAVVDAAAARLTRPPSAFRVVAIMPVFNEADILDHTLRYLVAEGIEVYVIDNWSTDDSFERARAWVGRGVLEVERFPKLGPQGTYDLRRLLGRVEAVSTEIRPADWFVLHDVDERRRGPWPGVSLREALWRVDQRGFTCIDHLTLNFWPVDNRFDARRDVATQLEYCEPSAHPGHFHQRRAWKNLGQRVDLASTAGHDVQFSARRVDPYRFLLQHYPIRSQQHGEQKVLRERLPRFSREEQAFGWHAQYAEVARTRSFVRQPDELVHFEPTAFASEYLVERLSGLGVFETPPAWATPMRPA